MRRFVFFLSLLPTLLLADLASAERMVVSWELAIENSATYGGPKTPLPYKITAPHSKIYFFPDQLPPYKYQGTFYSGGEFQPNLPKEEEFSFQYDFDGRTFNIESYVQRIATQHALQLIPDAGKCEKEQCIFTMALPNDLNGGKREHWIRVLAVNKFQPFSEFVKAQPGFQVSADYPIADRADDGTKIISVSLRPQVHKSKKSSTELFADYHRLISATRLHFFVDDLPTLMAARSYTSIRNNSYLKGLVTVIREPSTDFYYVYSIDGKKLCVEVTPEEESTVRQCVDLTAVLNGQTNSIHGEQPIFSTDEICGDDCEADDLDIYVDVQAQTPAEFLQALSTVQPIFVPLNR